MTSNLQKKMFHELIGREIFETAKLSAYEYAEGTVPNSKKYAKNGSEGFSGCPRRPWQALLAEHRVRFCAELRPHGIACSKIRDGISTRKAYAMRRVSASSQEDTRMQPSLKR
jgi:hypothetical protein